MAKANRQIIKIVRQFLVAAQEVCPVDKAILFGSHARGAAGRQSDIDIAVFSRTASEKNRLQIMTRLLMLSGRFHMDIQPVVYPYQDYLASDNDFISVEIKGKGIEIPLI